MMCADDFDGGPEYEMVRQYLKTQLRLLRQRIESLGVRVEVAGYQRSYRLGFGSGTEPGTACVLLREPTVQLATEHNVRRKLAIGTAE